MPRWLVAMLLLAVVTATSSDAADVPPAVGHRAPDFTLRDPDGTPVQLSRVFGERAVLVNFWATEVIEVVGGARARVWSWS